MAAIPFTAASKRIIRLEYIVVSDERPRLSTGRRIHLPVFMGVLLHTLHGP